MKVGIICNYGHKWNDPSPFPQDESNEQSTAKTWMVSDRRKDQLFVGPKRYYPNGVVSYKLEPYIYTYIYNYIYCIPCFVINVPFKMSIQCRKQSQVGGHPQEFIANCGCRSINDLVDKNPWQGSTCFHHLRRSWQKYRFGASDGKIWQADLKTLDFASWRKKY